MQHSDFAEHHDVEKEGWLVTPANSGGSRLASHSQCNILGAGEERKAE